MMARLEIFLLGGFQASLDGVTVHTFESEKSRALLAYLAVQSQRGSRREVLASLLWPNRPESAARADLRQTLHRLRRAVGDLENRIPFLMATTHEIQINPSSSYCLDAEAFCQGIASCRKHHPGNGWPCDDCLERLENAASLYQGSFLAGFSLPDTPQFQWWQLCKQEEYHRLAMEILTLLANSYEYRQDYPRALHFARQKISLEPWYEPAHRRCMRLLALSGQRGAALRQYQACQDILEAEMGIQPSPLTRGLYEQILSGECEGLEAAVND